MTEELPPGAPGGLPEDADAPGQDLPEDPHGPADGTLGGYLELHLRPPALLGSDGYPYTVSLEVEQAGDLTAPYCGYLVFPRWAEGGIGILGHLETPVLLHGTSRARVEDALGDFTLERVHDLLEEAIRRQGREP